MPQAKPYAAGCLFRERNRTLRSSAARFRKRALQKPRTEQRKTRVATLRRRYDTSNAASQFPRLVFQTRYGGLKLRRGLRRIVRLVAHKSSICVAGARRMAHRRTGGILRKFAACAKQKCTRLRT